MKALRALMLVLALTGYAYAGEMPNLPPATPPDSSAVGNMPNLPPEGVVSASSTVTEAILSLLQSVLSAF